MDKPSRILKAGFHSLAIIIGIVIGLVEAVLLLILLPRLGVPRENVHGIAGGFALANILLARLCADRVLKWFGQSRSGRFRETQTKMLAKSEGFVADDEVVEVSLPRTVVWTLIGMCLTIFLILLLILALVKFDGVNDVRYVYAAVALSGTCRMLASGGPGTGARAERPSRGSTPPRRVRIFSIEWCIGPTSKAAKSSRNSTRSAS